MSMMSSQKLGLKLTCNDVTKRVREIPETFEALKSSVKAQMGKVKGPAQTFIQSGSFSITY
jgi:hypothetical protein